MIAAAFWLFLACSLLMMTWHGGAEGSVVSAACALATLLTFVLNNYLGFVAAQLVVALLDAALLVVGIAIALRSTKFWPIWFSGFHMIAVASGTASQVFAGALPKMYTDAAGFWALPALGAAVLGIMRDRQAGLKP